MKRLLAFLLIPTLSASAAPVISELVASNDGGLQDEDGAFVDWVELYNPDDADFDLDGHFLTDDPDGNPERWSFPSVSLPSKGYLIIYASGKNRRDPEANLHSNFRLSASGESLALVAPDGAETLSAVTFPPLPADHSYGVIDAEIGSEFAISNAPSPNEANAANVVLFSIKGRAFTDSVVLELSSPGGQAIRYTEDGRRPSLFNGRNYADPITIDETAVITASSGGGPFRSEVFIKIDPELAERSSDIPLVIADASATLNQTTLKDMAFAVIEPVEGEGESRARLVSEFSMGTRGGIRTRGETSNSFPKKPLRVEFWDPDDEDRDLAPLGMPAGSDWVLNARYTFDRTLMHNAWIYELSNELGQWAPRTRFVELYLNDDDSPVSESDYQGIYTFMESIRRGNNRVDVERLDIGVTEEPEISGGYIFKKDKTDPGTWNFNGGSEPLQMVSPAEEERADRGAQSQWLSGYLDTMRDAIRDHGSNPDDGYPAFIEVDAWLDHHHLNFLTNNVDALRLSAYFHKPRGGKVVAGPIWDFDRSAGGPSDGRIANPLQWGDGGGGTAFFVRGNHGTPVWWQDLFENRDFLQAWVDRWYELRLSETVTPTWDPEATPLPAFGDENVARIIDHMAEEMMEAQERNFEKWRSAGPRNANQLAYSDIGGFAGEIEHIKGWLKARSEWVEDEFITVPSYDPATVVHQSSVNLQVATGGTLFKPAVVYYTIDGTDPRMAGGEPNPEATKLAGTISLTQSARVIARRIDNDYTADRWGPNLHWSAPADRYYYVDTIPADETNLVISEIMYHPAEPTDAEAAAGFDDADDFEFIELFNISNDRVDLTDARLRGAADFNFADRTLAESGERLVLVRNTAAFVMRYGEAVTIHGEYQGQLGNGGAVVRLRDYQGIAVREFTFDDDEPWPEDPDGSGKSLVLRTPSSNPDPSNPDSWAAGSIDHGTPGADESDDGGGNSGDYETWLASQFTEEERADAAVSGPDADADGDGLPTLAEFLVGGIPLEADPGKVPTVSIESGEVKIVHVRSAGAASLTVSVESSEDLIEWSEVNSTVSNSDGFTAHAIPLESGARYLRLKLTL